MEGAEGEGEGEVGEVEEWAEGAGPRAGPLEQKRGVGRGERAGQPETGRRPPRKEERWAGAMPHPPRGRPTLGCTRRAALRGGGPGRELCPFSFVVNMKGSFKRGPWLW